MKKILLIGGLLFSISAFAQVLPLEEVEFKDLTPEEKEKLSTKGKQIVSMKAYSSVPDGEIRPEEHFVIGVIAKTKDGKEIKTPLVGGDNNLNYNYDLRTNAPIKMASNKVEFYVNNPLKLKEDQFKLIIKDRFHENMVDSLFFTVKYDRDISILTEYKGVDGANGIQSREKESCLEKQGDDGTHGERGKDAPDLKIYVQKSKHTVTGETVYPIQIDSETGTSKGYVVNEGNKIVIKGIGGKGGNGSNITSACAYNHVKGLQGDGGNGAFVRITSNIENFDYNDVFDLVLRGGAPGNAGQGELQEEKENMV